MLFSAVKMGQQLWFHHNGSYRPIGKIPFGWVHLCAEMNIVEEMLKISLNGGEPVTFKQKYIDKLFHFNITIGD